ncbi:hypothetical protein [Streptomyces yanii]|uniref:Uncharacterized protein n=1 Tax=Streptomyces yanii TaxID=78510 RepID=A0ABV5R4E0_9ACTN
MVLTGVLDAIDAVDWAAVPGRAGWYRPGDAASGLRDLASAAGLVAVAEAASRLAGGGLVHGHSGAVFPAAVIAAPILLDIVEGGLPSAGRAALGLLDEALSSYPFAGDTRVGTPYGAAVPLCCALADHIRARRELLAGHGRAGTSLLAEAAGHWRFVIDDCVGTGSDTSAFGVLAGTVPDGSHPAELHTADGVTGLDAVRVEYPPVDASFEACLRVVGAPPGALPAGAVVFPAVCGEREH